MKIRTAALSLAFASALFAPLARADIPPVCDMFADRVTCAKADLGTACSTGGTCYEVTCSTAPMAGGQQTLYKCEACPPLIDGGGCSTTYGAPCAEDAGSCRKAPPWCNQGQLGIACFGPQPALAPAPHDEAGADANGSDASSGEPSVPAAGGDSGGGCTVALLASRVSRRAALPSFLLSAGVVALMLDRLRQRKRHDRR